jgi:hypothetical protein
MSMLEADKSNVYPSCYTNKQLPWNNTKLEHKIHASLITLVSAQHIPVPPNCCPVQSFWQETVIVSEPLSVSSKSPCSLIWSSDCSSSPNTQKHKLKYHYHITQLYRRISEGGNCEKNKSFFGTLAERTQDSSGTGMKYLQ